ncbi:MAG: PTS IIA-like nitrogen regulatory protein PtsN [Pseudomonadota bacterium]
MEMTDLLSRNRVTTGMKVKSKKQLLQNLAAIAARDTGFSEEAILNVLIEREHLGSTGVGNGVAIPHGKLPNFQGIIGAFATLATPLDFDAIDDQPVDVVFMLLAPEGSGAEHLKALSRIARVLKQQSLLGQLRQMNDPDVAFALLTTIETANAA